MSEADFWNKIADKYFADPIKDVEAYEHKLSLTRQYMTPEDRVFEFGCGTGGTARLHAPYVKEIIATDISERMIEIATEEADMAGISNVHFQTVSIEAYQPDAPFDMVLGLSIIHLLRDWRGAIAKAGDMVKPGGYFVSGTACLGDRMWWLRFIIPVMQWIGKAPYVAFIKEAEMIGELENAGFEIVEHYLPKKSPALFIIARKRST